MRRWGRRTVKPGVSYYVEELGNQERRVRRIARLLLAPTNSSFSSVDLPSVNNAFTRDSSGGGLGDPALLIDSRKLSRVRGSPAAALPTPFDLEPLADGIRLAARLPVLLGPSRTQLEGTRRDLT
jgi:hypothetical protein